MNITDLIDSNVIFQLISEPDIKKYWDYEFYAKINGEHEYMQTMNTEDLRQLRENCKKIIELTDWIENGNNER